MLFSSSASKKKNPVSKDPATPPSKELSPEDESLQNISPPADGSKPYASKLTDQLTPSPPLRGSKETKSSKKQSRSEVDRPKDKKGGGAPAPDSLAGSNKENEIMGGCVTRNVSNDHLIDGGSGTHPNKAIGASEASNSPTLAATNSGNHNNSAETDNGSAPMAASPSSNSSPSSSNNNDMARRRSSDGKKPPARNDADDEVAPPVLKNRERRRLSLSESAPVMPKNADVTGEYRGQLIIQDSTAAKPAGPNKQGSSYTPTAATTTSDDDASRGHPGKRFPNGDRDDSQSECEEEDTADLQSLPSSDSEEVQVQQPPPVAEQPPANRELPPPSHPRARECRRLSIQGMPSSTKQRDFEVRRKV